MAILNRFRIVYGNVTKADLDKAWSGPNVGASLLDYEWETVDVVDRIFRRHASAFGAI